VANGSMTKRDTSDDFDVLVLGGGMAGLAAAARSVQKGARVALIEKGERVGGSAIHAEFIWTAPTLEVLLEINPLGDAALGGHLISSWSAALDWVVSLGIPLGPEVELLGFGTGHQVDLRLLITAMQRIVSDGAGSELLLGTEPESLVQDDEQRVVGAVVVGGDGSKRTVRARHTVLATGGFSGSPELRAELIGEAARELPLRANPYSNGRGLTLGRSVGAGIAADDAGFYGHLMAAGVPPDPKVGLATMTFFHSEHGVLVNWLGRRFVDETLGDHLNALATLDQPAGRALLICDARVHREWMLTPYVPGLPSPDKFAMAYRLGARCATADSVEEFADLPPEWGYPGDAVRDTLLEFNSRVATNGTLDPPRRRDAVPLTEPPYYVLEVTPAVTFTFTGLRTDPAAHVLDGDGQPIRGLLAAGADAGGLYVRAYAGGLAPALVFGLTAAETAAIDEPAELPVQNLSVRIETSPSRKEP
jgi:succinate dehydrogenase/fumarate reductase flavoprotein subunit